MRHVHTMVKPTHASIIYRSCGYMQILHYTVHWYTLWYCGERWRATGRGLVCLRNALQRAKHEVVGRPFAHLRARQPPSVVTSSSTLAGGVCDLGPALPTPIAAAPSFWVAGSLCSINIPPSYSHTDCIVVSLTPHIPFLSPLFHTPSRLPSLYQLRSPNLLAPSSTLRPRTNPRRYQPAVHRARPPHTLKSNLAVPPHAELLRAPPLPSTGR